MKKKWCILFTLCILPVCEPVQACDICGCGAGSYYIGILPEFSQRITGIRYRSTVLTTHLGPGGSRSYLTTAEKYHTVEWWAGWTVQDKFRLMVYLPVGFNVKSNESGTQSKAGLSDASVLGFYRLFRSNITLGSKENAVLWVQDLWIGGGLKLPTGMYNPGDKNPLNMSTNLFQLGTGSLDYILMAMYDIRRLDAGLNITAGYKINTTNKYGYYYGNRFNVSAQLYYKFRFNNRWMIAPNAGLQYENAAKDFDGNYSVRPTGGTSFLGTLGAEMNWDRVTFGGNFQPVLAQDLGKGAVRAGSRLMLHCAWLF